MIDAKYSLKYSFPHSVVHIIDNSYALESEPVSIADDPSLYGAIVVSAMPYGEDNKIISLTRSDVANVAFGMNSIGKSDIEKYGQTITYPASLLKQGAPVKILRVTPSDATYSFACLIVEWKKVVTDSGRTEIVVRYSSSNETLTNLENFANPKRIYNALVSKYYKEPDATNPWNKRLLMAYISAGRGKNYNNLVCSIDSISQGKRPANVCYTFSTIDTKTNNNVVEQFTASLVNINQTLSTKIDEVNAVVSKRVKGSSVVIPFLNESAVQEVYETWYEFMTEYINGTEPVANDIKVIYNTVNINTFDMLFGNYIYNGNTGTKLPLFNISMEQSSLPLLNVSTNVTACDKEAFSVNDDLSNTATYRPIPIEEDIFQTVVGTKTTDAVTIGNFWLKSSDIITSPNIRMVTCVNQSTGNVTSIALNEDSSSEGYITYMFNADTNVTTKKVGDEITIQSTALATDPAYLVSAENLAIINDANKIPTGKNFILKFTDNSFVIVNKTVAADVATYTICDPYSVFKSEIEAKYASVVGYSAATSSVFNKPGYMYIENKGDETNVNYTVGLNTYGASADSTDDAHGDHNSQVSGIIINDTKPGTGAFDISSICKTGTVPTNVSVNNIDGTTYDVKVYEGTTAFNTVDKYLVVSDIPDGSSERVFTDAEGNISVTINAVNKITSIKVLDNKTPKVEDYVNKETTFTHTPEAGDAQNVKIIITGVTSTNTDPYAIKRFVVSSVYGSLYRIIYTSDVPTTYYSIINKIGINPSSKFASIVTKNGSTGFLDDPINTVEEMVRFKYKYSQLLVDAYRGKIDYSIMSPTRCAAKYLFDGGTNTIIGLEVIPTATYQTSQLIENSTVFSDEEIEAVMATTSDTEFTEKFKLSATGGDIDVKQAMFDLMEFRVYQGIPEEMRPIGPGSGLSLHLDSGMCESEAVALMNSSFSSRFNNPNCSWDIGGYTSSIDGITYTYVKNIVDNLIRHCKETTINTHYSDKYAVISRTDYSECFPDIDTIDWDIRETTYNFGGNTWIPDINGNIVRRSQRTMYMDYSTSDLVQESNMRTLSQLVFLLQNKINGFLHEYNDDNVLKTLSDEVDNMFSTWNGTLVQNLSITFARDKNVDGGDIIVCNVSCTFRGIILRVPIIVDVTRRS